MKTETLLKKLKEAGLEPYLFNTAMTGSIYIKFKTDVGGSLRVGDHSHRSRYAFRWNLRKDLKEYYSKVNKGHICYYYPITMVKEMILNMQRVKRNKETFR